MIASEFQVLSLVAQFDSIDTSQIDINYFPHEEARALYKALLQLREQKESITEGSLLREANKICDKVDADMVSTLFGYQVDLSNFTHSLTALKEGSVKYRVNSTLKTLQNKLTTHDTLDVMDASSLLYEAQSILDSGQRNVISKTLEQSLDEYVEELEERKSGELYSFGDEFMDSMLTRKANPGQIILIAGSTGAGKSTFALNLINGMINIGTPCIYFSLEMDTISTMDRLLSMRTDIPVDEWYQKENIPSLIKKVKEERRLLEGKAFRIVDDPDISLSHIQNIIRDFKMTYKTDYVCVFIDLVTQVPEFTNLKSGGTLANTIEISTNRLNAIAKKENCCIVAIAQMNRDADNTRIGSIDDVDVLRPTINHIKNSHAMGERSRVVLSVFRPRYYIERLFPEAEELEYMADVLQVQVLKQSQGMVGNIGRYLFDGPCFAIRPYVEEDTEGVELNY